MTHRIKATVHGVVQGVGFRPFIYNLACEKGLFGDRRLAFSTYSYTVDPIFFPGGDIGELAVNGTVNDLAMRGAKPLYLSAGFIIEEGFAMENLEKILKSMKRAAKKAHVLIVTGDTKVVQRGAVDKIFINTSGLGIIPEGVNISGKNARPGDKIILNGYIADHGMTVLTHRAGMDFASSLQSDTAPLNEYGVGNDRNKQSDPYIERPYPWRCRDIAQRNSLAVRNKNKTP